MWVMIKSDRKELASVRRYVIPRLRPLSTDRDQTQLFASRDLAGRNPPRLARALKRVLGEGDQARNRPTDDHREQGCKYRSLVPLIDNSSGT
jgi:hypothetical protein